MTSRLHDDTEACDFFEIEGTVDHSSEKFLRALPSKVSRSRVRFDFTNAGRINSMGIALLLRCFKEIREKKQAAITLEGLAPMHTMLFKMTGVFLLASPAGSAQGKGGV